MANQRPDPEELLARVREEERRATRGRLKIFFGASPGVGKTYAMLEEARARQKDGMDVVAGVVETHGRTETAALVEGLEAIPRRSIEYRGITLKEFDLDAALTRRPTLILVDELAHTNSPGSRHPKRWQDVEELLAAGIDVFTTLNVQHIESLNDAVAQITGVQVQETLPDSILDQADEVELADLSAEDLLTRLKEGKVYVPEQAARAIDQFFRKGNLIALRELALRHTAQRVGAQARGYRQSQGIRTPWAAGERLLVCIGPNPAGARLVRAGKRMATSLNCEWIVVCVETPTQRVSASDRALLMENLQLAQELGAQTVTLSGQAVAEEVLAYARSQNATRIIIGKPTHGRWRDKIFGSLVDQLVRGSGELDVYVITGDAEEDRKPRKRAKPVSWSWAEYGRAAVVVAACTGTNFLAFHYLTVTDLAMVYLLGITLVAARYGRGPSLFASFASIAAFDFCFVPPRFTFAVSDVQYMITFGVLLAIAVVISTLTLRIRDQAEAARERERHTAALYAMTRDFAATRSVTDLIAIATRHLQEALRAPSQILLPDATGRVSVPPGTPTSLSLDEKEHSVAQWAFEHARQAGVGTDTLPGSQGRYVPLVASAGVIGVLGVRPSDAGTLESPVFARLLETFAAQAALALERAVLAERAQGEQVEIEAERLRTSLLSSVSHDLRTPLGVITGAASSLLEAHSGLPEEGRRKLLETILEESQRMNRLIGNLLDMIRLESGSLRVQKEWQPLEETVGVALIRLAERIGDHPVTVSLPPDLPLVPVDAVLLEHVFINLLENAVKYTPPGTAIEISAKATEESVLVTVADRGPGLLPGEETRVFEKFFRSPGDSMATGVGLGLTICRGIITAHGGRIWADNRPGGGAAFHFTLPLSGLPPSLVPGEADPAG